MRILSKVCCVQCQFALRSVFLLMMRIILSDDLYRELVLPHIFSRSQPIEVLRCAVSCRVIFQDLQVPRLEHFYYYIAKVHLQVQRWTPIDASVSRDLG